MSDTLKAELEQAFNYIPTTRDGDYGRADVLAAIWPIVARLEQERDKLADAIKVQAAAVKRIDAKERAEYVATVTLDSERDMNAKLTEQLGQAEAERDALKAELPTEMEGQRILFEECVVGHGHLRGENWVKHPCVFCERDALKARIADTVAWAQREFIKPRHDDLDVVAHVWAEELISRLQKDGGQ